MWNYNNMKISILVNIYTNINLIFICFDNFSLQQLKKLWANG